MPNLIACRACGNQISSDAKACPKCGAQPRHVSIPQIVGGAAAVLAVVWVIAAVDRKAPNTSAPATPAAESPRIADPARSTAESPKPAPIEVSPEQLRTDYKANEVSADERYRGKVLLVTGTIKAITRGSLDEPSLITLATRSPFVGVFAYFDRLSADALSGALTKLSHGSRVRVRCVGDNLLIDNPRLKDCALQ